MRNMGRRLKGFPAPAKSLNQELGAHPILSSFLPPPQSRHQPVDGFPPKFLDLILITNVHSAECQHAGCSTIKPLLVPTSPQLSCFQKFYTVNPDYFSKTRPNYTIILFETFHSVLIDWKTTPQPFMVSGRNLHGLPPSACRACLSSRSSPPHWAPHTRRLTVPSCALVSLPCPLSPDARCHFLVIPTQSSDTS